MSEETTKIILANSNSLTESLSLILQSKKLNAEKFAAFKECYELLVENAKEIVNYMASAIAQDMYLGALVVIRQQIAQIVEFNHDGKQSVSNEWNTKYRYLRECDFNDTLCDDTKLFDGVATKLDLETYTLTPEHDHIAQVIVWFNMIYRYVFDMFRKENIVQFMKMYKNCETALKIAEKCNLVDLIQAHSTTAHLRVMHIVAESLLPTEDAAICIKRADEKQCSVCKKCNCHGANPECKSI